MKTIATLSENKENLLTKTKSTRTWYYCYSCGANLSHISPKCTSKYKYTNHKNKATFKDIIGGLKRNLKVLAVRKLMSQS